MPLGRAADIQSGSLPLWRKIRRSIRDVGLLLTVQIIAKRVLPERVLRVETDFLVEVDIRDWPKSEPIRCMRWATHEDLHLFARSNTLPRNRGMEMERALARRASVAICVREGELIGYFLYESDEFKLYDWICFRLAPDVIWNYDVWVAPAHRGEGLHGRMRHFAVSEFSGKGYVRTLAVINALNISALRASIKKGKTGTIVGYIAFVRLFGVTLARIDGTLHLGFWGPSRPLEIHSDRFQRQFARPSWPLNSEQLDRLIG